MRSPVEPEPALLAGYWLLALACSFLLLTRLSRSALLSVMALGSPGSGLRLACALSLACAAGPSCDRAAVRPVEIPVRAAAPPASSLVAQSPAPTSAKTIELRAGKWRTELRPHGAASWIEDHALTTFNLVEGRLGAWIRTKVRTVTLGEHDLFVQVEPDGADVSFWRIDTGARVVLRDEAGLELRLRDTWHWSHPTLLVPRIAPNQVNYLVDLERGTSWRDPSWPTGPEAASAEEFAVHWDGKRMLRYQRGGSGEVWDLATRTRTAQFGPRVREAFWLDDTHLAVDLTGAWPNYPGCGLGPNGGIAIWNLQTHSLQWSHQEGSIESVSPNRDYLLVGVNGPKFKGWRIVEARQGAAVAEWSAVPGHDCPEHIWRRGANAGLAFRQADLFVAWIQGHSLVTIQNADHVFYTEPLCANPKDDTFHSFDGVRRWEEPAKLFSAGPRRKGHCAYSNSGRYVLFDAEDAQTKMDTLLVADKNGELLQTRVYPSTYMNPVWVVGRDLVVWHGTEEWLCLDRPKDEHALCVRMANADGVPFLFAVTDDGAQNASENLAKADSLLASTPKPPVWDARPALRYEADLVRRFVAEAGGP